MLGCGAGGARTAKSGNRHVGPLKKPRVTNPQTCRPGSRRVAQEIRRGAFTGLDRAPDIVKGENRQVVYLAQAPCITLSSP